MEYLTYFIIIIVILILVISYLMIVKNQVNNRKKNYQNSSNLKRRVNQKIFNKNQAESDKQINELKNQLLKLVNHDAKIVERLINNLKVKHPDKSENWYWEKAILDLERDRRLY